jgi:hypothetical protein
VQPDEVIDADSSVLDFLQDHPNCLTAKFTNTVGILGKNENIDYSTELPTMAYYRECEIFGNGQLSSNCW